MGLPPWVGEVGRVVWPLALLLLFVVAFDAADAGDRLGETAGGIPAGAWAECAQPPHRDILVLERCLTIRPDDVELLLDLGGVYESGGRWADAERVYWHAVRVDPRDGDAHLGLGRTLLARGDVPAARREGQAALAMQPAITRRSASAPSLGALNHFVLH